MFTPRSFLRNGRNMSVCQRDYSDFFISTLPHSVSQGDLIRQLGVYNIRIDRVNIREREHDRTRFAFLTPASAEDFSKIRELKELSINGTVISMKVSRERSTEREEQEFKARQNFLLVQADDLGIDLRKILITPSPKPNPHKSPATCQKKYHSVTKETEQVKLTNTVDVDPMTNKKRDKYAIDVDPLVDAPFDDINQDPVKFTDLKEYYNAQSGIRPYDNFHQSFDAGISQLGDLLKPTETDSVGDILVTPNNIATTDEIVEINNNVWLKSLHSARAARAREDSDLSARAREPSAGNMSSDSGIGADGQALQVSSSRGVNNSSNSDNSDYNGAMISTARQPYPSTNSTDSGVSTSRSTQNSTNSDRSSTHSLSTQKQPPPRLKLDRKIGQQVEEVPKKDVVYNERGKKTRSTVTADNVIVPDVSEDSSLHCCKNVSMFSPETPATSTKIMAYGVQQSYDEPYYFNYFTTKGEKLRKAVDSSDKSKLRSPIISSYDPNNGSRQESQNKEYKVPNDVLDLKIQPEHICGCDDQDTGSSDLQVPVTDDLICFSPEPLITTCDQVGLLDPVRTLYGSLYDNEGTLHNTVFDNESRMKNSRYDDTQPTAISALIEPEYSLFEGGERMSATASGVVASNCDKRSPPTYDRGFDMVNNDTYSSNLLPIFKSDLEEAIKEQEFEQLEGILLQTTQIFVDMVDRSMISVGEIDRDTGDLNNEIADTQATISDIKQLMESLDDNEIIEEIKETDLSENEDKLASLRAELWVKKISNVLLFEENIRGFSTDNL